MRMSGISCMKARSTKKALQTWSSAEVSHSADIFKEVVLLIQVKKLPRRNIVEGSCESVTGACAQLDV